MGADGLLWQAVGDGITLTILMAVMAVAGVVRGFTGFGTALVFMPVAGGLIGVGPAIVCVVVTGMASWPFLLPRAWHEGERREVTFLVVPLIVSVPLGVAILGWLDPTVLRWVVSIAATIALATLVSGWRYRRHVGRSGLAGVGVGCGVLGGVTGMAGVPAIMFYLAGDRPAYVVRANTIMLLCAADIVILSNLFLQGRVDLSAVVLGAVLAVPYTLFVTVGQRLFSPAAERIYRGAAYGVIALAILSGLPLFD